MHPQSSWSAFEPLDSERAATTHEQARWRKTPCLSFHQSGVASPANIVVWIEIPWRSVARWAKGTPTNSSKLVSWLMSANSWQGNNGPQQGEAVVFSCWCLNTLDHWTLTSCLGLLSSVKLDFESLHTSALQQFHLRTTHTDCIWALSFRACC